MKSLSTKWIVIGVVSIFFMVFFREEISEILKRTKSVTIDPKGVTLETPIGITEVNVRRVHTHSDSELYPEVAFETYHSKENGYAISYPRNGWVNIEKYANEGWGRTILSVEGYSFGIISNRNSMVSTVVVRIYWIGHDSMSTAVSGFIEAAGEGVKYLDYKVLECDNSATLSSFDSVNQIIMVSRIVLNDGWLFDLRASTSKNSSKNVMDEMNQITNSFRFVN